MLRIDTILIPTDFSPPAMAALTHGLRWARTFGAQVHLLHTLPAVGTCTIKPLSDDGNDHLSDPELADIAAAMQHALATAGADDVRAACFLGFGPNPTTAVLTHAREVSASLIILGTHGEGLFDAENPTSGACLGSLAAGMTQHATCPVLFIPEADSDPSIRRILVHVSLLHQTSDLVRLASALAARFGASLDLLHVASPAPPHTDLSTPLPDEDVRRRLLDSCVDASQAEGPRAMVPEVTFYSRTGYMPLVLAEFAREHASDLLMIMAPGFSNAEYNSLQAEREHTVHRVSCPVLAVKPSGTSLLELDATATRSPMLSSAPVA